MFTAFTRLVPDYVRVESALVKAVQGSLPASSWSLYNPAASHSTSVSTEPAPETVLPRTVGVGVAQAQGHAQMRAPKSWSPRVPGHPSAQTEHRQESAPSTSIVVLATLRQAWESYKI